MLATLLALGALMMAASPAMAQDRNDRHVGINDNRNFFDRDDRDDRGFGTNDIRDVFDRDDSNDCVLTERGFICDDDNANFGFFGDNDVGLDVENEAESGDVQINNQVSNEGDFAMQCTPALQFGQTGNLNNAPAFLQFGSGNGDRFDDFGFFGNRFDTGLDDFEPGGIDFAIEPTVSTDCNQSVVQTSVASG